MVGPQELLIVGGIAVLIFGAKKLPELGAGLGKGIRNFKSAVTGADDKKVEGNRSESEDSPS